MIENQCGFIVFNTALIIVIDKSIKVRNNDSRNILPVTADRDYKLNKSAQGKETLDTLRWDILTCIKNHKALLPVYNLYIIVCKYLNNITGLIKTIFGESLFSCFRIVPVSAEKKITFYKILTLFRNSPLYRGC